MTKPHSITDAKTLNQNQNPQLTLETRRALSPVVPCMAEAASSSAALADMEARSKYMALLVRMAEDEALRGVRRVRNNG